MIRSLKAVPWSFLGAGLLFFVTGSLTADAIKGDHILTWLPVLSQYNLIVKIIVSITFVGISVYLYTQRHRLMSIRTLYKLDQCKPRKALILLLTQPNFTPIVQSGQVMFDTVTLSGNLQTDIDKINNHFPGKKPNWQQILRALQPHQGKLDTVYIIPSPQSATYRHAAESLIRLYFPNAKIKTHSSSPDFENLDALIDTLKQTIKTLRTKYKYSEKEITVDVTGGQKTASIAGAMITLFSAVTFQYVQTNPPYRVLAYDAIVLPGEIPA